VATGDFSIVYDFGILRILEIVYNPSSQRFLPHSKKNEKGLRG
jgi:hypothetical protein